MRRGPPERREVLGASVADGVTTFRVYTTTTSRVAVRFFGADGVARETVPMSRKDTGGGTFFLERTDAPHGTRYKIVLDEDELPDPYARFMPDGPHAPAMVIAPSYAWRFERPKRAPLSREVTYELHVGTFTREGTYAAAARRLAHVKNLGATLVELMPISTFPGQRGWGYDGVGHYAPFAPYGTPDELRSFIDEAHGLGLGVLLDVVYNHFGPDGNYLRRFSEEYFAKGEMTRWGDAPDFGHAIMRDYVVENARYWLEEFRFDGLRLDATHVIVDASPRHILREVADVTKALAAAPILVAEDEMNDPDLVLRLGMDAIWADDFHHQLHATLTEEDDGYYAAFTPSVAGIAEAITRGWLYEGALYAPWDKHRGKPMVGLTADNLVYSLQNHDQVGNRAGGERLSHIVSLNAYCAASLLFLFLPASPLLFMGQEWAASTPFLYFTDHEPELGSRVSAGRRDEFRSFRSFHEDADVPDPQAETTFTRSRLEWDEIERAPHSRVLELYRAMLALRRDDDVLAESARERLEARVAGNLLLVRRWKGVQERLLVMSFGADDADLRPHVEDRFRLILQSGPMLDPRTLPKETSAIFAAP
jgi:maltooligosyltrehalose trehalohydrolase